MGKCPFLSSGNQCVECFENCAFYNLEDTNGECPFKLTTGKTNNNVRRLYYNNYMGEEYVLDFEEEYEKAEYL